MEQRYDDGRVIYPFGKNVEGRIYYGADKSMFCAIQKCGRTPFSTGKQWTADDTEKACAYNDYLTYCGRYELLDGDTATTMSKSACTRTGSANNRPGRYDWSTAASISRASP